MPGSGFFRPEPISFSKGQGTDMDLKVYYQKIQEIEGGIAGPDAVVVSLETQDGGRPGVKSEVPKRLAAKLVVEGKARLASKEEQEEYRHQVQEATKKAKELAEARKMRVAIIPESEWQPRRSRAKQAK